ncbi:c-type cytochrome [Ramlibacter montanisoli]|uniref:Cytochrome c n=1 Tax=Ramlibacter montanisoli TaxID=2732512 RepID=A0A849KD03_9BURK|nr:cytochrome c [Ramlibacter montanisoli]NNU43366.1 cytochrome c [Ramlibacter montanisoli]
MHSTLIGRAGTLVLAAAQVPLAGAQDLAAGKARADAVCGACHGANGVSVSDTIPNLAGQKSAYLQSQLRALKEGTRKNAIMGAIAAQPSAEYIANVAAHYASLHIGEEVAGGGEPGGVLGVP